MPKRTAEEAGLQDMSTHEEAPESKKILRVPNYYLIAQSCGRYALTGRDPRRRKNQVMDTVDFMRRRPDILAQLQVEVKKMPKDAEDEGVKGYNVWFSRLWLQMSDEQKLPYIKEYERLVQKHELEYPDYKYEPQQKAQLTVASVARKATQTKPKRVRAPKNSKKVKASATKSPQSITSSPSAASSSSSPSFSPGMPFTPGTALHPLGGSPAIFPDANLGYANADASYSKQQYDPTGAYLTSAVQVPESPYAQGSPNVYNMGAIGATPYWIEQPMLDLYTGYATQPVQTFDANTNAGWNAHCAAPPPAFNDVGENGLSAVLGGGYDHSPQGNNALLDINEPQYGFPLPRSSPLFDADLDFLGLGLGGSPGSAGSPLDDIFGGDFGGADFVNFGTWPASGSPVMHGSAPYPGL